MDFLKTLLLYMSMTMAAAVQEGPLPADVPTPPPALTAIVEMAEETPAPEEDLPAFTAMPQPTPVIYDGPTITPNTSYRNVKQGDRGESVLELQRRLIELGYLPDGSDDGAFGGQTKRAVEAFQAAHGLVKDGVAGDATQTHLYQNPNVITAFTPSPEPVQTPEPVSAATEEPVPSVAPGVDNATIAPPAESGPVITAPPASDEMEAALGLKRQENASILFTHSGSVLSSRRIVNGVFETFHPHVWIHESGTMVVSFNELAECISLWQLTSDEALMTLTAEGYEIVFDTAQSPVACTVDEVPAELPENAVFFYEGNLLVSDSFLQTVFHATSLWDSDESSLIISIPDKAAAQAND